MDNSHVLLPGDGRGRSSALLPGDGGGRSSALLPGPRGGRLFARLEVRELHRRDQTGQDAFGLIIVRLAPLSVLRRKSLCDGEQEAGA